jgi:O-antigen ligase
MFNINNALDYKFKQTTGIVRFIRQYGSLIIASALIPLTFYNVLKKFDLNFSLKLIRKTILASLVIVLIYSVIEVLIVKYNMIYLKKSLLNLFDYFPFTEAKIDLRLKRISSVSFEPPALGTYLLSISAWMFSYVLTETKKWKYLPTIAVLFLAYVSGSRAAFFIVLVQLIVAIYLFVIKTVSVKNVYRTLIIAFFSFTFVAIVYNKQISSLIEKELASFKIDNSKHSLSNKSRFGIQQAMFRVFVQNPISGVGYGLQAFESSRMYPVWAKKDNWEFRLKYLNQNDKRFPPGYNLYIRILSETGVVGFLIFGMFLLHIFLWCFNNLKSKNETIVFIIFISMIGFSLNWLKMDSFRIYFFWLCLAILWILDANKYPYEK